MTWLLIIGAVVLLFGFVVFFGAPYVPSQRRYVRRMFEHIKIGSSDLVVDLGSGDGLVLRSASSYGARAVGFELNPFLWLVSKLASAGDKRVSVQLANAWATPFPKETTIVYAFAVARDEKRLVRTVQREALRLKRPLRLVCLGSPLKSLTADGTFEAYAFYTVPPRQGNVLTV
jgi:hypothetical protein